MLSVFADMLLLTKTEANILPTLLRETFNERTEVNKELEKST